MKSGKRQNGQIPGFRLQIPRETWLEFLRRSGSSEFEVVEIQYGPGEREYFKRGVAYVKEAREKLAAGEYDEAVSVCRKVIEAAGHEAIPGGADALKQLFVRAAGEKRGTEYGGVLSKVKQLGAFAHHDFGSAMTFSRAEAQFVVRVTESLLSLAANFASRSATVNE